MKKILILAVVASLFAASSAMAQTKMGVVDIQKAVRESNAGKKAQEELNKLQESYNAKLQPMRDEISKMEQEYITQEKALTDAAKKSRLEAMQAKAMEFDTQAKTYSSEFQKKEGELMSKIFKDLEEVVNTVGKEGKYDAIFFHQAIMYGPNIKDLTDEVIKKYNSKK